MDLMPKQYIGITVTLTIKDTAYSLAELLKAVDANVALTGREVGIQVDASPSGTVRVGDADLTADTRCGRTIASGSVREYRSHQHDILLSNIYLMGSVDAMIVHVEIMQ